MKWRLLNTRRGNACFNMALDEAIFLSRRRGVVPSTLRIYSWDGPAVTFGYFQKIDTVQSVLKGLDLLFVRRMTGGGIVLHQSELTFSIACECSEVSGGAIRKSYQRISKVIATGLRNLGLDAGISESGALNREFCFSGAQPGDVVVKNRKLAGGAQRRSLGILLHQGSILLERNREFGKFTCGGISVSEVASRKIAFDEIKEYIIQGFEKEFSIVLEKGKLTEQEKIFAERLVEKYKSPEWNRRV